mgnify:FL=1
MKDLIAAFSPLSIGSLSVTYLNHQPSLLIFGAFQSPFYRVFECNRAVPALYSVSTEMVFQSPFYRVFECNKNADQTAAALPAPLSVPFLSGL